MTTVSFKPSILPDRRDKFTSSVNTWRNVFINDFNKVAGIGSSKLVLIGADFIIFSSSSSLTGSKLSSVALLAGNWEPGVLDSCVVKSGSLLNLLLILTILSEKKLLNLFARSIGELDLGREEHFGLSNRVLHTLNNSLWELSQLAIWLE